LQHLQVAIRVAEGRDRSPPDVLPFNSGRRTNTGMPFRSSNLVLILLPTTWRAGPDCVRPCPDVR
jgi:hypothetical protein